MVISSRCLTQLGRLCLTAGSTSSYIQTSRFFIPLVQVRHKADKVKSAGKSSGGANRPPALAKKLKEKKLKNKKKVDPHFKSWDLKDMDQFALCDAIRYIQAFEVGEPPISTKYDLHLKFKTSRNGPVIRNRIRLPHPIRTDVKVCVICPPESKYAVAAKAAGASIVGEDDVFEAIKEGKIDFDACVCQNESLAKLNKSGVARILGPKGLMPSAKTGTVVKDPAVILKDMIGGSEYRERRGVVRMAIGQLAFTPEELSKNIKTFMDAIKKDVSQVSENTTKELEEVVLSASHSPGFSLNGLFRNPDSSITSMDLSSPKDGVIVA